MTQQEIFTKVYTGLQAQEFLQCSDRLGCHYIRSDRRCAVGHLIPDDLAHGHYDRHTSDDMIRLLGLEEHRDFVQALLYAHDASENPHDMRLQLQLLAAKHSLEIPGQS